jgi:2-C-methyl-D-erythritol 2,4-cyclodiphosphate synthase
MSGVRIGQGIDIHRFGGDGPLVLCGVELPGETGLLGHSDADVAVHAVCDALYGAVAAGDLGEHFPSTDSRWRDAASRRFLDHAVETVRVAGFRVASCDLTLIGERPRIADQRPRLRRALAEMLDLEVERVSVKATTTDGLGFTGRGEGLAASAIVLLEEDRDG